MITLLTELTISQHFLHFRAFENIYKMVQCEVVCPSAATGTKLLNCLKNGAYLMAHVTLYEG